MNFLVSTVPGLTSWANPGQYQPPGSGSCAPKTWSLGDSAPVEMMCQFISWSSFNETDSHVLSSGDEAVGSEVVLGETGGHFGGRDPEFFKGFWHSM